MSSAIINKWEVVFIHPKISVIVPVYNVEKYLPCCVESILLQSAMDIEIILVDDGSTDNCPAICDAYAQSDSRIRVIHQSNGGLSAARNAGIDHATGEYLCFIDSDDLIEPQYCRILYDAAKENNCLIAACRMRRFTDGEQIVKTDADNLTSALLSYHAFLKEQMTGKIDLGVCNKSFHRSIFDHVRFMPGKLHEDIILAGDLLSQKVGDVAYVDIPLYHYRQRADSIVNSQKQMTKCSPDRVWAGEYLLECAKNVDYPYMDECLAYVVRYPWYFVDPIYVHARFKENWAFLNVMQRVLRENRMQYRTLALLEPIQRRRMMLFSRSKLLYGVNAYFRLLRVYVYRVLRKDAYADGHGI